MSHAFILHNRTLLLMVIIIHLLAGFSYGHAELPEDGGMSQAGNLYLDDQHAEVACHEKQQDQAQVSHDVDCAGQCLACCGHGPCGPIAIVSALNIPSLDSKPAILQIFAKAIHPFIEPRPPRLLRHYA